MKDSTKKKLIDWGFIPAPGQSRKELFSLPNVGSMIVMLGIISLIFGGIRSGWVSVLIIIAIIVFGLVLTVIGAMRQVRKEKETQE